MQSRDFSVQRVWLRFRRVVSSALSKELRYFFSPRTQHSARRKQPQAVHRFLHADLHLRSATLESLMPSALTSKTPQTSPHFHTALLCPRPSRHSRSSAGAPNSAANLKNVSQMLVNSSVKTFLLRSPASSHALAKTSPLAPNHAEVLRWISLRSLRLCVSALKFPSRADVAEH